MIDHALAATIGLLCWAAGASAGLNGLLMSSNQPNYPTKGWRLQVSMFGLCTFLMSRGGEILETVGTAHPLHVTPVMFGTSVLLVAVQAAWLEDTARSRLSAKAWARITQMLSIFRCGHSPAWRAARAQSNAPLHQGVQPGPVDPSQSDVVDLAMSGLPYVAPGAGPEALAQYAPPKVH